MKKILLLSMLLSVVTGCCRKMSPAKLIQTDNYKVEHETKYIEKIRFDTVFADIPTQSFQVQVKDSVSILKTEFAISEARIFADGTLYHDLVNRAGKQTFIIPVIETEKSDLRDSIVYRNIVKEVPVEISLRWWQIFWIRSGQICWLLLAVFFLIKFFLRKIK